MDQPFLATIVLFGGNFAPRGWAFCNGQLLPISENEALFALIGTTYGGDGQVTFALPDLRGRAPVDVGQGPGLSNVVLGEVAGTENVTLTTARMPTHTHVLNVTTGAGDTSVPTNALPANTGAMDREFKTTPTANAAMHSTAIGSAGNSQAFDITMPYLGMNYIIALEGIFPSQN